mmetsp:Transcript_43793/g.107771  ORF Transcript_43793/g.107771 Transcript_43793/m.107771 type:complete len:674 (-) Transcript_43793:54-2075(-)
MRAVSVALAVAGAASTNPINKVLQLLDSLAAKVTADGEKEQAQYEKFTQWCEENAKETQHELKNSGERQESLQSVIDKTEATISNVNSQIQELSASIAQNEADLEKATAVRKAEHKDFAERDEELVGTIDTLERALQVVKKELAFGQVSQSAVTSLVGAATVMLDDSLVTSHDRSRLQAFVQQQSEAADGFEAMQAPATAAYETHGGTQAILQTFEDLLEKAESQRSDTTKAETEAQFNFEMLKQSLTDELKTENKELAKARSKLAANKETLSATNGDLTETNKDASADSASLRQLQTDCMQTASDHEVSVKDRSDELKALAEAKRVIQEATGGATSKAYGLVQVGATTRVTSPGIDGVVSSLRQLGRNSDDIAVALLASQISSVAVSGDDVFAKVKGLIRDMLQKISEKARADAKEHEWCTTKTKETEAKKADHESEVAKLNSRSDRAKSAIARAEADIAQLEAELGALAKMQAEMDQQRSNEHAENSAAIADYQKGVEGVQAAIKALKSYYGKDSALLQQPVVGTHSSSGGAAGGIIGLLEVCESDFSKLLAEVEADEKEAQEVYERQSKDNRQAKAEKETSLKYTQKTLARTEKALAEINDDTEAEQSELDATLEYLAKVNKRCVAKPETYASRKAKRESEIEGLKNALKILEEETAGAFLAVRTVSRHQ